MFKNLSLRLKVLILSFITIVAISFAIAFDAIYSIKSF